ncbi:MAG: glutathione S-transferase [Solirubrobacteraceae bacterium]|jgi:glutathione S-transferase|nr:glutathione S-transferase [Solirubrobacteraceae bacterium]
MPAEVKLYMFPGSNSVLTGRLMLDHKRIAYDVVTLMPGAHAFVMLALGFQTMGVPALKIDGRRVQGTRAISRALDELVPDRPLFPADPALRRAVEDAERWGEELQNATRRIFYCAARRDHAVFRSVVLPGRKPPMRAALRLSAPLIIRLASGAHRASDDAAREDLALLPERLDQIDAWIAEGLLDGDELNAADFQIAVNVSALMLAEELAPFIEGRPAAALARRVAPDYAGRMPAGIMPPAWLGPLRDADAARIAAVAAAARAAAAEPGGAAVTAPAATTPAAT